MKYKIGNRFIQPFCFSQNDVFKFAEVTGDNNPIHFDTEYARNGIFGQPIMHGLLSISVFGKVFGTIFPGKDTIWIDQTLSFKKPMFVDCVYNAIFEIVDLVPYKHRMLLNTTVKIDNEITITGTSLLQNFNIEEHSINDKIDDHFGVQIGIL